MSYQLPFTITTEVIDLIAEIQGAVKNRLSSDNVSDQANHTLALVK